MKCNFTQTIVGQTYQPRRRNEFVKIILSFSSPSDNFYALCATKRFKYAVHSKKTNFILRQMSHRLRVTFHPFRPLTAAEQICLVNNLSQNRSSLANEQCEL